MIAYKSLYWKEGIIDHEDVLYFAHRILFENPAIRSFLASRFPYVFIDEFQDTLAIQAQFVKWLASEGTIVGVIGDAEQSIYGFVGATPEHFRQFALPLGLSLIASMGIVAVLNALSISSTTFVPTISSRHP